jgi:hypothetical protein
MRFCVSYSFAVGRRLLQKKNDAMLFRMVEAALSPELWVISESTSIAGPGPSLSPVEIESINT